MLNKAISTPITISIVFVIAALLGGITWWQFQLPEIEPSPENLQEPQVLQESEEEVTLEGNVISIESSKEGDENFLIFNINLEDYLVESVGKVGYEKYGDKFIRVSPDFELENNPPFVEIESIDIYEVCKPMLSALNIEIELPLNSEITADLTNVKEEILEEKIDIVPMIQCERSGFCMDCPNYLTEDYFFPEDISVYSDSSEWDTTKKARIKIPLFRHNPAIRETYMVREASIKVVYKVTTNLLTLKKESVPTEVKISEKFKVSYLVTNPYNEKIEDLRLKLVIQDKFGKAISSNFSERFSMDPFESKSISSEIEGLPKGSYLLVSQLDDSKSASEVDWIYSVLP